MKLSYSVTYKKNNAGKRIDKLILKVSDVRRKKVKYYLNSRYLGSAWSDVPFETKKVPAKNKMIAKATVKLTEKRAVSSQLKIDLMAQSSRVVAIKSTPKTTTNTSVTWLENGTINKNKPTNYWQLIIPDGVKTLKIQLTMSYPNLDVDLIGKWGAIPTWWNNNFSSCKYGNEEVILNNPKVGILYLLVDHFSGAGRYQLSTQAELNVPVVIPTTNWGSGGKYALIVGISDYQSINDLSFCDEDATDWYNYLIQKKYECRILGDLHNTNYPRYDGLATEKIVRETFLQLLQQVKDGDSVILITSGHGSGDGKGNSYLCLYNCNGINDGAYWDYELAQDIQTCQKNINILIFIDNCYSGGMLDNLKSVKNLICLTTCTDNGYGYDQDNVKNGAWTYCFLHYTLQGHFNNQTVDIAEAFKYAKDEYPKATSNINSGDQPMILNTLSVPFVL